MNERLTVFDLGLHNGDDTSFYLQRGFRVVAVEADTELCEDCRERFGRQIRDGDLHIVNKAVAEDDGKSVEFLISSLNTEWSSVRPYPEMLGEAPKKVIVETTTLRALIAEFGLPHYIKCDLEGSDAIFCRQLAKEKRKPDFVSVEATSLELLALLAASGYDTFQLTNNAKARRFPSRTRFDNPVYGEARARFAGHCSGEFGFDLPADKWISFEETSYRWLKHLDLLTSDPDTVLDNWFDFHAATGAVLHGRPAAADGDAAAHDERSDGPRRSEDQGLRAMDDREARVRMLRRALDDREGRIWLLRRTLDDRDRTLARRDAEIEALGRRDEEMEALVAERAESRRLLAERHGEIMALVAERAESNRLLTERHGEIMALVERLEAVWGSWSWRLTRPLRALRRPRSSS